MEVEGGVHEICEKQVRKFWGEAGSGLIRYVMEKYIIFVIISQKFQCSFNIFLQNRVKTSILIPDHVHLFYCHYIDIYLCLFGFESQ